MENERTQASERLKDRDASPLEPASARRVKRQAWSLPAGQLPGFLEIGLRYTEEARKLLRSTEGISCAAKNFRC
jgi:hypothetical protein